MFFKPLIKQRKLKRDYLKGTLMNLQTYYQTAGLLIVTLFSSRKGAS